MIDRILLRWARPENVRRLAAAVGCYLPPVPTQGWLVERWRVRAARVVARHLELQRAAQGAP